jgi:hypothetical protein
MSPPRTLLDAASTLYHAGLVPRGNIRLGASSDSIVPLLREDVRSTATVLEPPSAKQDEDASAAASGGGGGGVGGSSASASGAGGARQGSGLGISGAKGGMQFLRLSKK